MAVRYAVKNGLANDPTTWDGGTLPVAADNVYAGGFLVTITANFTCNMISNMSQSTPSVPQGGRFEIAATAVVTIATGVIDVQQALNNTALISIVAGSHNVTLIGSLFNGGNLTGMMAITVLAGYTGVLVINGNIRGGYNGFGCRIVGSPASVTVNGWISGGVEAGAAYGYGLRLDAVTTLTINGDVIGGKQDSAYGVYTVTGSNVVSTIKGNIIGGDFAGSFGSAIGFNNAGGGALTVTGDVTSKLGVAIANPGTAPLTIRGKIKAINSVAVTTSTNTPFRLSGSIVVAGAEEASTVPGRWPLSGPFTVIPNEPFEIILLDASNWTSMAGDPVSLTGGAGGSNVVVPGNSADVVVRGADVLFGVAAVDANNVTLLMPAELDAVTELDTLTAQLSYVFGSEEALALGWLTVIAKGILGLADSSDPGGAPDYIPVVGTVTISPSITKPLRIISTAQFLALASFTATFDSNGELSYDGIKDVRIIAPQWSDLSNTAWKWNAEVRPGAGQGWASFSGSFTGAPGAIFDLASLL